MSACLGCTKLDSINSTRYFYLLTFPTDRGICFSLKPNPLENVGFRQSSCTAMLETGGNRTQSEAWEASVLPLNYARSLFLIIQKNEKVRENGRRWENAADVAMRRLTGSCLPHCPPLLTVCSLERTAHAGICWRECASSLKPTYS